VILYRARMSLRQCLERIKLALHLRARDACTRFVRQLAFIREALARYRARSCSR
jgi:hypothetical protein